MPRGEGKGGMREKVYYRGSLQTLPQKTWLCSDWEIPHDGKKKDFEIFVSALWRDAFFVLNYLFI